MHPHFGFSFVSPARELLWKVSSGPRSEKVARLWALTDGYRHVVKWRTGALGVYRWIMP